MSADVLSKIDETLTFYSAGLGEEVSVPVERREELATWPAPDATVFMAAVGRQLAAIFQHYDSTLAEFVDNLNRYIASRRSAIPSPKAVRRWRRAQLRRVHREYVQHKRRAKAETWLAVCVLDETHRFAAPTHGEQPR